jgi:hypothetical protein
MNDEVEECGRKWSVLKCYLGVCLETLKKTITTSVTTVLSLTLIQIRDLQNIQED